MPRLPAYRFTLVLFIGLVLLKFSPQSGFSSLIRFGETWNGRRHSALQALPLSVVRASNGYDGQFYAQLALAPTLRDAELDQVLDAPTYRSRRILVPALAALLGFGHPWWVLQVYALLNALSWLVFAWLLYRFIGANDWESYARWLGCVFSMGVLESVRQSLVDLPALCLLLLAVEAHASARFATSTLWLAMGNLAKESSVLAALALEGENPAIRPRWRQRCIILAVSILPLAAWSLYVQHRFPSENTGSGLGNITWPLFGLFDHVKTCMRALGSGEYDGRFSMGLVAAIAFLVQLFVLWRTPQPRVAWWRIGAAYSVLFLVLSPWVWSGYWAACRALLPMTVAFNLLLPGQRNFWTLWALGNLTLLHGIWRFL